jgi:hypothetical protein
MNAIPEYSAAGENIKAHFSAVDAIAPAFRRTRSILAAPFRLGFFIKICLIAALTESGFFSAVFSYPVQGANAMAHAGTHALPGTAPSSFLADGLGAVGALGVAVLLAFLVLAVVGLAVWCLVIYLFCRLRFTVLDLAIYREGSIRRAWRKYARQAWRYFGLTILVVLVFLLIMAAVIGPFIPAFVRVARSMDPTHPDPFAMLGLMLPLVGAILLLSLIGLVVDAIIRDFLLPQMAVEDASIEAALHRFFGLLRHDFGQMVLYLFMRILLTFALSASLGIILVIPVAMLALVAVALGVPLYHSLWMGGAPIFFVLYAAAAGSVVLLLYFLAITVVFGVTSIFKLCYAVLFFGSRYAELGSLLNPAAQEEPVHLPQQPPEPPPGLPVIEPPPLW